MSSTLSSYFRVSPAVCGVISRLLKPQSGEVAGSDRAFDRGERPRERAQLERLGIVVAPQDGSGVTKGCQALVVSTAVEETVPDVAAARRLNLPIIHRSELLAHFVHAHRTIAVTGTSGKSTVVAMIFVAQLPPAWLRRIAPVIYFVGILLLIAVTTVGPVRMGAQRWIDVGPISFQPSELMKIAVPMMAAWYLHERALPPSAKDLLVVLLIVLVPAGMVAEQPDHLGRRLQMALGVGGKAKTGFVDRAVLADAGQHVLQRPPLRAVVEHVVGRDQRNAGAACEAG